ncbi:hypothetical protein TNCT_284971, partial [Trichonephila clavata]
IVSKNIQTLNYNIIKILELLADESLENFLLKNLNITTNHDFVTFYRGLCSHRCNVGGISCHWTLLSI